MAARSGILGLGSRLYFGNMQRIFNKDLTRFMQSLSRERQNRASKRKALLAGWVLFCFHANWPLWPHSRLNILLNFTFENEAIRANLHENKRTLKWRPFWNKMYDMLKPFADSISQHR